MISEVLVMQNDAVSKYPFMFVKKHNKIVLKKMANNTGDVEGVLYKIFNNFSKFSTELRVIFNIDVSSDLLNSIKSLNNVKISDSLSDEMKFHSKEFFSQNQYIRLGEFKYLDLNFISMKMKLKHRTSEKLFFQKDGEAYNRFISRILSSVKAMSGNKVNCGISFSSEKTMNEYREFKWHKKVNFKKYDVFNFDVENYLRKNEREIENRFKSEIFNIKLKEKYAVNPEEIKQYKYPIVVYPDGSVFPDGKSGVGVVFVKEDRVIHFFGKSADDNISANTCESVAIYEALSYFKSNLLSYEIDYFEIRTDSLNCIRNIDENSNVDKTAKINEMIEKLRSYGISVNVRWNKGHSGIFHNEMADILAKNVCGK